MNQMFGLMADGLVAVLLVAAIVTSVRLSRRLTRFKADEPALRATIASLVTATDAAERATAGLRGALAECERNLGERMGAAEQYSRDLAARVSAGEAVLGRLGEIADLSRKAAVSVAPPPPPAPARTGLDTVLSAAAASAQAVAERAARRLAERAAA